MSVFVCPNCGHESHIFSHGGAKKEAERLGMEFLGEMPLDIAIRETSDSGKPITISDPESPQAKAYSAIAKRIWEKASALIESGGARQAPKIVMQ
jgi:ATP-binding protein involved in chromosome partitioning